MAYEDRSVVAKVSCCKS